MRYTILLLAALAFSPAVAAAQGGPDRCGDQTGAQDKLEDLAHYFTDDEDADFREGMISQVSATTTQEVVTDRHVCNAVYHQLVTRLRTNTNWRDLQRDGFKHVILRYGPYYAVLVDQIPPPGKKVLGWTAMLIFRVSDTAYLGTGMV
jgi:hypothetical protein